MDSVRIIGQIKADNINEVLVFVVYQNDSTKITTDGAGHFNRIIKADGLRWLSATNLKSKSYKRLSIDFEKKEQQFGIIDISSLPIEIKQVEISENRPMLIRTAEKATISLDKKEFLGDNIKDALVKIPGIILMDNRILFEGNNPVSIYVNGKELKLPDEASRMRYLQSLQASEVQEIEVYNPSARNKTAGYILNVNLKPQIDGYSIAPNFSFSTGEYSTTSASVMGRLKKNKLNGSLFVSLSNEDMYSEGIEKRFMPVFSIDNQTSALNRKDALFSVIDLDYAISERTLVGISSMLSFLKNNLHQEDQFLKQYSKADSTFQNRTDTKGNGDFINTTLFLKKKMGAKGSEMVFSVDYNYSTNNNFNNFTNDLVKPLNPLINSVQLITQNKSKISVPSFNLNYFMPFTNKKGNLDFGARFTQSQMDNSYFYLNNFDFSFQDQLLAAFVNLNYKFNKSSLQAGIRAEHFYISHSTSKTDFTYLLPFLSYQFSLFNKASVNFRYNKSMMRPNFASINPSISVLNPFEARTGNPDLQPPKTHQISLSVSYKGLSISNSLAYVKSPIQNLPTFSANGETAIFSFLNLKNQLSYTLNASYPVRTKYVSFFPSVLFSNQTFKSQNASSFSNNSLFLNLSNTYTVSKFSKIDLSYSYTPYYGSFFTETRNKQRLNVKYNQLLLKNALSINVGVEDLFNSAFEEGFSKYGAFYNTFNRSFDTRRFVISASYTLKRGKDVRVQGAGSNNMDNRNRIMN